MEFSLLIVVYLFLAGSGCGAFVAAVLLSWRARTSPSLAVSLGRVALPALVVSCGMAVVGSACLVLDLGRPELALSVLANPAGSVLSVGAWALVAFMGAACVLIACSVGVLGAGRILVGVAKAVGCVAAFTVMAYSGLFLSTIATLPLLASPLVPVLFVLSSLSCGGGVVLLLPLACDAEAGPLFREVSRADVLLLAGEALALAVFVVLALGDHLSSAAVLRLVEGDLAPVFWGVLVLSGIVAPLVLELAVRRPDARASACLGGLVLAGGFALRYCLCAAPFAAVASYL